MNKVLLFVVTFLLLTGCESEEQKAKIASLESSLQQTKSELQQTKDDLSKTSSELEVALTEIDELNGKLTKENSKEKELYLDCEVTYSVSTGRVTLPSDESRVVVPGKGDSKTYEINIDLANKSAEVPAYSSEKFVENSNDPKKALSITSGGVTLGTTDTPSYWYAQIDRDDLSFNQIGKNSGGVYGGKGKCVLVEERSKPKGF